MSKKYHQKGAERQTNKEKQKHTELHPSAKQTTDSKDQTLLLIVLCVVI